MPADATKSCSVNSLRPPAEHAAEYLKAQPEEPFGTNADLQALMARSQRADKARQESERLLQAVLSIGRMATWRWNRTTDEVIASENLSEIMGLPPGEKIATSAEAYELVHPEDVAQYREVVESAARAGESWRAEYRIIRPCDGRVAWIEERATGFYQTETGGVGEGGILWDITERKLAEEALRQSEERARLALEAAEIANQAKDRFLSVLSHELRTPLTPVVMATSMMQRRGDLDDDLRQSLAMIRRNVDLECRLIDDLLDVTRVAQGTLEISRHPVDLHAVIRAAVELAQPEFSSKEQSLGVDLHAAEFRLQGDASRLQQAVWNLLKNASKFTPPRGRISIASENREGRIVVAVADSGAGLAADKLTSIFEAFAQADARIARTYGGLGLGLAIAQASIHAHGGTIRAESAGPDQGALFTFELPLAL